MRHPGSTLDLHIKYFLLAQKSLKQNPNNLLENIIYIATSELILEKDSRHVAQCKHDLCIIKLLTKKKAFKLCLIFPPNSEVLEIAPPL